MKESDAEGTCVRLLLDLCPGAVIYKHADQFTAGIPDRSITWHGYDSWLEFKMWEAGGTFYSEFATDSGRANPQLLELLKLERQTGRAWVIAYRKANPKKLIKPSLQLYRPRAMVDSHGFLCKHESTPIMSGLDDVVWNIRLHGHARFEGFDHRAVVALIHLTHRPEYDPHKARENAWDITT